MRLFLAAALVAAWLLPAAASANTPARCLHLASQLVHYDSMKQRAAQLGNPMWTARFEAQIEKVEEQHAQACPEQAKANQTAQQLRDLLLAAGRGALSFFTLGAF